MCGNAVSGQDSVLRRLDSAHLLLNRITISRVGEFNTRTIEQGLPRIGRTLQVIAEGLPLADAIPEFKQLDIYDVMLGDIAARLGNWRTSLFRYHDELAGIDAQLESYSRDPEIRGLAGDTLYLQLYVAELRELQREWQQAKAATMEHLKRVKTEQLLVSKQYFLAIDLKSRIVYLRRQLSERLFKKERRYLWERGDRAEARSAVRELALRTFGTQWPLISYFIYRNGSVYCFLAVTGVLFFWWLWRFRRRGPARSGVRPFLYAMIFVLGIHPLLELHAATLPVCQLPLLAVLSVLFWLDWPKRRWVSWAIVLLLYLFLLATRTVLVQLNNGMALLLLNLVSLTFGYHAIKRIGERLVFKNLVRIAFWSYIILNGLAIVANVAGRQSLTRIFTTSAIFGIIQAIGLSVWLYCLPDLRWNRVTDKARQGISRFVRAYAFIIWLLTMGINLDIYEGVRRQCRRFLYQPLTLGSFHFEPVNIVLFALILYFSNVLQKGIGIFYDIGEQNVRWGSRLAMWRLLILIVGFLLAVAASGVPLDRITIILGALGVGIGLGLQNLVNNIVSGFILVFERPFQIGDLIEVNLRKGIVRDIGMRSSRIATEDGGEIILPNGDLLAGQVVNWTARDRRVRIAVSLLIEGGHTVQELEPVVREALAGQPWLAKGTSVHVLINSATARATRVTVLAWVTGIGRVQAITSEMRGMLYQRLQQKDIHFI